MNNLIPVNVPDGSNKSPSSVTERVLIWESKVTVLAVFKSNKNYFL